MNKICTDISQSKKLIELGIDINTADMWWAERYAGQVMANGQYIVEEKPVYCPSLTKPSNDNCSQDTVKDIPCWSLAALLDLLNKTAYFMNEDASVDLSSYKTTEWDLGIDNSDLELVTESNPVDACYEMILKLKEQNLL